MHFGSSLSFFRSLLFCIFFQFFIIANAQFPGAYVSSSNYSGTYNMNNNLVVGSVGGKGGVSSGGSTNYSVPIQVPSGLNGLVPSVSINYSSNNGNGISGYGFCLSATSSIAYDSKGLYYDAVVAAADITNGSAFALDGNRLILTTGTYGQSGAVYSTASETFSKITSSGSTGTCSSCPQSFSVITRNGMTMEYGNTTDSRVTGNASTFPFMWLLNKVTDNYGNYLKYSYTNNSTTGEVLLMQIDYYTSTNTMYAQVEFGYTDNRSDKNTIIEYGSDVNQIHQTESNKLLTSIEVKSENQLVREYELKYSFDGFYSFLQEIILKGADGITALNPTWFNYGEPTNFQSVSNTTSYTSTDFFPVDVDGDGFDEIFAPTYTTNNSIGKIYGNFKIYKVNATTGALTQFGATVTLNTTETFNGTSCSMYTKFEFYDMNGDGREDVVFQRNARYLNKNYLKEVKILTVGVPNSNSITLTNYTINTTVPLFANNLNSRFNPQYGKSDFYVGDFDGDGRGDIIVNDTLKSYISFPFLVNELNKELFYDDGTNPLVNFITQYKIAPNNYSNVVNADNDAKSDLMIMQFFDDPIYDADAGHFYAFSKNGSNQYIGKKCIKDLYISSQNYQCFLNGDFNGDGLSDYFNNNNNTGTKINTKQGKLTDNITFTFQEPVSYTEINKDNNTSNKKEALLIDDFNGDGKDDVLHFKKNANNTSTDYFYIYYFNGLSYTRVVYTLAGIGSTTYFYPIMTGDFNGDGRTDVLHRNKTTGAFYILYFKPKGKERLLTKVRDGMSNVMEFSYKLLTEDANYTYTNVPNQYPMNEIRPAFYVVDKVKVPDGVGGAGVETQYFYKQLTRQKAKAGILGFLITSQKNLLTNAFAQQEYEIYDQTSSAGNCMLVAKQNWACVACSTLANAKFKTVITTPIQTVQELGNKKFIRISKGSVSTDLLHNNTTTNDPPTYSTDGYYNILSQKTKEQDGSGNYTEVTVSTPQTEFAYINTSNPIPTLPKKITTVSTVNCNGVSNTFTKIKHLTYEKDKIKTLNDDGNEANNLYQTYTYDAVNGNLKEILSNTGTTTPVTPARKQSFEYHSTMPRFLKDIKDVNNEIVTTYDNYDARWEKPTVVKNGADPNNIYTILNYHSNFGYLLSSQPSHFANAISYATNYSVGTPTNAIYKTTVTQPEGATVSTYYDLYNRVIKTETTGDKTNISTNEYNAKGELLKNTSTGANGSNIETNYSSYDAYSRVGTITTNPNISSVSYLYTDGTNKVKATDNNTSFYKESTTDASGNLVKVTDAITAAPNSKELSYTYFGNGSLMKVKSGGTDIQTIEIDANGFQKKLIDNNAGATEYKYNVFGEVYYQKDANNNETTLTYDAFGRIAQSVLANSSPQPSQDFTAISTNYSYYGNSDGFKKYLLKSINNGTTTETYDYDNYRRNNSISTVFDGITATQTTSYGNYDKINKITYPNNFVVEYDYTGSTSGVVQKIKSGIGTATTDVFLNPTYNNAYQCTQYDLGYGSGKKTIQNAYTINGLLDGTTAKTSSNNAVYFNYDYNWDLLSGNLTSRTDVLRTLTESFGYDNANFKQVLTAITQGTTTNSINYAANGNITNKYDAGFSTDPAKPAYSYGSSKPNAVTEIKQINTTSTNPAPSAISTETQDIKYNGFHQPVIVKQLANGTGTETTKTTYQYGIGAQRIKSIYTENSIPKCTTYYFGNYEKHIDNAGTRDVYYINTPDGLGAIAVNTGGTLKYYYAVKDHLGSILTLTDEAGVINSEQSFDAWGRWRKPSDWTYGNYSQPANSISKAGGNNAGWFTRGYTGHEHLYTQDLINMNGRMYDPIAGRMLSADNYVQDPTNLHNFNRYSYVMNNPLKYTDPSGQILEYAGEGIVPGLPEGTGTTPGGGGGGGGGDQHSPSGWDPTMGGHSMFGQVANVYGTLAAMAAYATGYSSGPGMGFGSAFAGRGYVSQTGFYISSHTTSYENAGLNGYVGGEKVPIGESTTYKTYEYSVFNNGTLSGNYWTGGSGVDMNNATACNGCDNIGLNTSSPRTGFFNKTLNYVNNHKLDIIGTFGGAAEYELGRRLSKPMFKFYQPLRLSAPGWSKYSSKIEPFASEYLSLSKYAKGFKIGGAVLGGIGLLSSGYGIINGFVKEDNTMIIENSLDLIMGGVGFIPGWGWAASGAYFLIAKPLYNHYIRKEGE
ncbi:MAG: RHS repeat-associated core domain-containing protein [Chitinophagales bacterium]